MEILEKNTCIEVKYEWIKDSWRQESINLTKEERAYYKVKECRNKFKNDEYWTWMKTSAKVGLTINNTADVLKFFNYIGLVALNYSSELFFNLKNFIYFPLLLLNISDSSYQMNISDCHVKNCTDKVKKWMHRPLAENFDDLHRHYSNKLLNTAKKVADLTTYKDFSTIEEPEKTAIEAHIVHKQKKIRQWNIYLKELEKFSDSSSAATQEPINNSLFIKNCTWKIEQWKKNLVLSKQNTKIFKVKCWLNVACQIAKFAIGIFTFIVFFLGFLNPIFSLLSALFSVSTRIFGLINAIYSAYHPIRIIKKPHLILN